MARFGKRSKIDLGRQVAVKFLSPSAEKESPILEHAQGIAKASGHPNVVAVHMLTDVEHPETKKVVPAVVLELLDGPNLSDRLATGPSFTAAEAKKICSELIDGIEHLHRNQLTHCDFHSQNVMIVDGTAKIIDIDYSRADSLQFLNTLSQRARFEADIRGLRSVLRDIVKHSDESTGLLDVALKNAASIQDIRATISEIGWTAKPTISIAIDQTKAEFAIKAIEENHNTLEARVKAYMEEMLGRLHAIAPDLTNASGLSHDQRDEALIEAIDKTTLMIEEFIQVVKMASDGNSTLAVKAIFRGFSGIFLQHERWPQVGGTWSESDFDFFRFVGCELALTFAAVLLRDDRMELLSDLLADTIYVENAHGYNGDLVGIEYAWRQVVLLAHRNERLQLRKISPQTDLLVQRYLKPPLSEYLSIDDLAAADLFMSFKSREWPPYLMLYTRRVPKFIIQAKRRVFVKQFAEALGLDMLTVKEFIVTRLTEIAGQRNFGRGFSMLDLDKALNAIDTMP